jgi:3',5'-cyclic-AMP phosphodiesterase
MKRFHASRLSATGPVHWTARRHAIAFGLVTLLGFACRAWAADDTGDHTVPVRVSFGVISDVHYGVLDWARPGTGMVELDFVRAFLDDMRERNVNFIIQLGDFCKPSDGQPMLDLWNTFPGRKYHVLGNHERDGGHTFESVATWLGMPSRYYVFDQGPIRGIVLDANEPGGGGAGYAAYVGTEQQQWLTRQLAETDRPVLVFVHQPIEALRNSAEVMAVLEQAERDRPGVIMAVFCGHHHQDSMRIKHNIPFIQINSASYVWYDRVRTVRYAEPLWGRVTIDFAAGVLRLDGRQTTWFDKDPWEYGAPESGHYARDVTRPAISDRELKIRPETAALFERLRRSKASRTTP